MRALAGREPDTKRRWVTRVAAYPRPRLDTNAYSRHPLLVGRRVEVRVTLREMTAITLDTGEQACRHQRGFARNRNDHRARTGLGAARV